jgi:hypothetical protein
MGETCDRCGRKKLSDSHDVVCEGTPFEGVCPMCGEPYRQYLDHLAECEGGE